MTLIKDLPFTPNGKKYTINAKYIATVNYNGKMMAFFSDSTIPKYPPLNLTSDQSQMIFSNDESLISKSLQVEVWPDIMDSVHISPLPSISQTRPWVSLDLRSTSTGFIAISPIHQLSQIQIDSLLKNIENWKRPSYDLLDKLAQIQFDPPSDLNQCYFVKVKIDHLPSMLDSYVYQHIKSSNIGLKDLEVVIADEENNKLLLTVSENMLDFLCINVESNWDSKDLDREILKSIDSLIEESKGKIFNMIISLNEICIGVYKWGYKCHFI